MVTEGNCKTFKAYAEAASEPIHAIMNCSANLIFDVSVCQCNYPSETTCPSGCGAEDVADYEDNIICDENDDDDNDSSTSSEEGKL